MQLSKQMQSKQKILIFIVSYNASSTIVSVLKRIPESMFSDPRYSTEVLIIDDCSTDDTFNKSYEFAKDFEAYPITILQNPVNQGYGGNQKIGYTFALKNNFDHVILLHGDGQYAPELLPKLVEPLVTHEADAVFGSRMLIPNDALKGGMPRYKYIGNKVLTWLENKIVGTDLSEYHSGLRLYSCKALATLPFTKNSNNFDFDTDIILQFAKAKFRIKEIPIPTYYGDEVCHVNGIKYAFDILCNCIHYQTQRLGIFYHPKFDFGENPYRSKLGFKSSHTKALEFININDNVLAIGLIPEDVENTLKKACKSYTQIRDLDNKNNLILANAPQADKLILFDLIEHTNSAEVLLETIRTHVKLKNAKILVFAGNIGFLPIRLMLLLGFFNYSNRGVLDKQHRRFFTFFALKSLLQQQGFKINKQSGLPAPYPLALGNNFFANLLLKINGLMLSISKTIFAYQICVEAEVLPNVETLLEHAISNSKRKIA